jgi:hypothetical protein
VRSNNVYAPPNSFAPAQYPDGSFANFERGFPVPTAPFVPANGIITNPDPTSAYFTIPLDYKNPYNESWNIAVQRTLPFKFTLDVAYVGSHGVHTPAQYNMNASFIVGAGSKGDPQYPRTAASTLFFKGLSSSYNSLQVKFDKRLSHGLMITTSFTYQKAMSFQGGDDGGLTYYIDQRRNYARADFDRRLNLVQSYIYNLPFGQGRKWMSRGLLAKTVGGWKTSAVLSLRSGAPFSITASCNLNLTQNCTQNANLIAPFQVTGDIGPGHQWFEKTSFASPATNTFGNTGRNEFTGPGTFGLNVSMSKVFTFTDSGRVKLDFRAESLNFTNTPQFSNPSNSITSGSFGQITGTRSSGTGVNGTGGGRVVQGGFRLNF